MPKLFNILVFVEFGQIVNPLIFLDLFLYSKKGKSFDDPIEVKKMEAQSRFLVGLLDTILTKCNPKPVESYMIMPPSI